MPAALSVSDAAGFFLVQKDKSSPGYFSWSYFAVPKGHW